MTQVRIENTFRVVAVVILVELLIIFYIVSLPINTAFGIGTKVVGFSPPDAIEDMGKPKKRNLFSTTKRC